MIVPLEHILVLAAVLFFLAARMENVCAVTVVRREPATVREAA